MRFERARTDSNIENLRLGTIDVRGRLPQGSEHITDKQIQEALWHYYYDVDKSVSYLQKVYMAKPKNEQKKIAGRSSFYFQPRTRGKRVRPDTYGAQGGF
jgi:elongation factor 1 alpha-like protein